MKKSGFHSEFFIVAVFAILLLSGCEEPTNEVVIQQPEPAIQQQEVPEETVSSQPQPDIQQGGVTYRVIDETEQTLKYEGSLANNDRLKGGHNVNRVEMTFTQDIQSINDNLNIVAKITIDELKVTTVMKGETTFDFDSSSDKDMTNPVAKLIGLSYTVEMSPEGQFVSIIDAEKIRATVRGRTDEHKRAQALLKDIAIERRHSVPEISSEDVLSASKGDSWSSVKSFEFPILGKKSYERVYTLKQIEQLDGRNVAVIDMEALPSAKDAEETTAGPLMDMFDNRRTYTGQLKLDLDGHMVESYYEKLDSEWLFVDPEADPNSDKAPASFRMGAIRSHSIEKIN